MTALFFFTLLVLAFGLGSRVFTRHALTGPMLFTAGGLLLGPEVLDLVDIHIEEHSVEVLAKLTLALVLFVDAARIDFSALRHSPQIPVRLLSVGLPLTVGLGLLSGVVLLGHLALWEAAILAAILAPTDAALGRSVVTNQRIPPRVRQALNVESGINDGLAVPFLFLFVGLAGIEEDLESTGFWIAFIAEQIGLGTAIGVVIGLGGAWLLGRAAARQTMGHSAEPLVAVSLALISFVGAELVGGSGFIAAFVAGLAASRVYSTLGRHLLEFNEEEGKLLTLGTFFIFGAAFVGPALDELTWQVALYAVLALTVVRMVPVAIALVGMGLRLQTVLFIGWFGPRGLASIVLALIVLDKQSVLARDAIFAVAMLTVLLSVMAHGATARPVAARFGRLMAETTGPEMEDVVPMPTRFTHGANDTEKPPSPAESD